MKLVLTCFVLVCALGGSGFGDNTFSRVGFEAVYFYPTTLPLDYLGWPRQFDTFRGLGCELGRVSGHFDLSLEAHWVSASTHTQTWQDSYAILYMVTPRLSYRLFGRRTPYIGAGSGYCLVREKPDITRSEIPDVCITTRTISFEPFAGYDLRLTKRFGLKLEGRSQVISPSEASFMHGMSGSVGVYVAFGGD